MNPSRQSRTLRARYLFPVTGEPIPDGRLTIEGQRIVALDTRTNDAEVEDLGNVAVLPGLVNTHTHLEFSDLAQPLGEPGMGLVDWIRRVMEVRSRQPTGRAVEEGLRESICSGTTTLGEIAQPGWPVRQIEAACLDITVFLELIAPTGDRVGPVLQQAWDHCKAAKDLGGWRAGLSPHAPYSVSSRLLHRAISLSHAGRVPIAFHLAESREELELLRSGTGPLREFLEEMGGWDPAILAGSQPLEYLGALTYAYRALIIHGNYLDDEEIAFLADRSQRMSVVYCPRTHAYFGHQAYPLRQMLAAGVTVALGTDSRASSPDLSLLAEMRFVARRYPAVGRDVVLRLGTINGARALGRDGEIGSLEPGKYANLAVVALPEHDAADPHELLLDSDEPVVGRWYRGGMNDE